MNCIIRMVILIVALSLLVFFGGCATEIKSPVVENGVFDFSGWDFQTQGVILLGFGYMLIVLVKAFRQRKKGAGIIRLAEPPWDGAFGRLSGTVRENLALKKKIEHHRQSELELKRMQTRLSRILDTLDDAIIVVNEGQKITFSNHPCERMLGYEAETLLDRPVKELVPAKNREKTDELVGLMLNHGDIREAGRPMENVRILHRDMREFSCRLQIVPLYLDREQLLVFILNEMYPWPKKAIRHFDQASALLFIAELNRNRERIQILEESMTVKDPVVRQGLKNIDATLEQMEKTLGKPGNGMEKRELGLHVMKLGLEYWKDSTGTTKIDLAHSSGLWKVHINQNGFERAQTLDKYFDPRRFPKRPRWNQIYQTVEFVLLSCQIPSDTRDELESAFAKLRMLK